MQMPEPVPAQPLPDLLAQDLRVVFCGLNPGVAAAAAGHHFLGRGNRFWPVLHLAGFTPYQLAPEDDGEVLRYGLGLTAVVARATRGAGDVGDEEYVLAAPALLHKVRVYRPRHLAFLGKAAYCAITGRRQVDWGEQEEGLEDSRVWVLPNPSGLNRSFTLEKLVEAYAALRREAGP
jgi:TDG/mug DNA glycosylase family protein